jgi:AcrR family transcriptional regulator
VVRDATGTRKRIIDAAERLFAEGGEDAASVRAVTQAAGVNIAAVQYHFGGREGLLRAVLDRVVAPINQRRVELLDRAEAAHGDVVPVHVLLDAFVRPDLEALADLRRTQAPLARIIGRAYTQPSPAVAGFADQQFQPVVARLFPLLYRTLPDANPAELRLRMRLNVAIITTLFATAPDPDRPGPLGTDDVDEQVRRLLAFCGGGLNAATTPGGPDDTP